MLRPVLLMLNCWKFMNMKKNSSTAENCCARQRIQGYSLEQWFLLVIILLLKHIL